MKKIGTVLNKQKNNTVTLFIKELKIKRHIKYFKIKKLVVDTGYFNLNIGDIVIIKEIRRVSKKKNHLIIKKFEV